MAPSVCIAATLAVAAASIGVGCRRAPDVIGDGPDAFCTALVDGVGMVDVENDYLPHVVACENGRAGYQALPAQAVAARSYLYYRLGHGGSIADGTSDQVYSCDRQPGLSHRMAVMSTAGQVLQYRGVQVAAFFVAGGRASRPDCWGGIDDPAATERHVTYNMGRSGDDVQQTTLGTIHTSTLANRGCQSQNGARCRAAAGWGYQRILRFYYGDDIELVAARGPCVAGRGGRRSASGCGDLDAQLALISLLAAIAVALAARSARPLRGRSRRRRR